jgi:hypothetical protein
MTDTTITSFTDRFGGTAWVVTWGNGLNAPFTIALSHEEAESIARGERQWVEPLVTFDASRTRPAY